MNFKQSSLQFSSDFRIDKRFWNAATEFVLCGLTVNIQLKMVSSKHRRGRKTKLTDRDMTEGFETHSGPTAQQSLSQIISEMDIDFQTPVSIKLSKGNSMLPFLLQNRIRKPLLACCNAAKQCQKYKSH
ncbi:hypothetical protein AVEN_118608-1 [Araneus ventricosus]|uniref:Uncharacterized protein n=1 Tax=Araneus ventricosus TaxID=182803 RepID=A0A4Y2AYE2_ARAVE|nr:hypothetical protein AVEN_118608-1 [Araneus ventricosus]